MYYLPIVGKVRSQCRNMRIQAIVSPTNVTKRNEIGLVRSLTKPKTALLEFCRRRKFKSHRARYHALRVATFFPLLAVHSSAQPE